MMSLYRIAGTLVACAPVVGQDLAQRVDAYLEPLLEHRDVSGYVMVTRGGEVLYERGVGKADWENDVANTRGTRFAAASLTKVFTATAIVRLVDAGKVELDDPLSKFLPEFPRGDSITVRQLLRHRAGIPHDDYVAEADRHRAYRAPELARRIAGMPLEFDPGSRSKYSTGGFVLLAAVIAAASGQTYDDYLRDHVFGPAGMTATGTAYRAPLTSHRATGHVHSKFGLERARSLDYSYVLGGGSAHTTARDLVRWFRALRAGEVLSKESCDRMWREQLGWGYRTVDSRRVVGFAGIIEGFTSFFDYFVDDDVCLIYLGNARTGAMQLLRSDLWRIVSGEAYEVPPRRPAVVEKAPRDLADYLGRFRLSPTREYDVTRDRDRLLISGSVLLPTGDDAFFAPIRYARVSFRRADDGAVTTMVWSERQGTWECPRIR